MGAVIHSQTVLAQRLVRYENGSRLAGIIYIHRISDERFTGISVRNFKMFRKLCGDSTLKNVILVTNMWGKVGQDVGNAREEELAGIYFKPALDKGAQLARHHNTAQSTHEIVRMIMKNIPAPLQIQQELVDERKNIKDTAAGEAIDEHLRAMIKRHEVEMNTLRAEMHQALKEKDEETRKELEGETRRIKEQMDRMRVESEKMAAKYNEERRRMEETVQRMQEQSHKERLRAHAEHMRQINELKAELERNVNASAEEREELLRRIHDLECKWNGPGPQPSKGGCIII